MLKRVQMLLNISGGRADGTDWPPMGYDLVTTREEAEQLISGRMALPSPNGYDVAEPPVRSTPPARPAAVAPPAEPDVVEAAEPGEVPKTAAPKQAWVEYAMSQGMSEDEAWPMSKQALIEKYGGRL